MMKKFLIKTATTILISGILATGFAVPAMAAEKPKGKDGKDTQTVTKETPSEDAVILSEDDVKDGNLPVLIEDKDGKLSVLKESDLKEDDGEAKGTVTEESTETMSSEGGENDTSLLLSGNGTVTEGNGSTEDEEIDPMPAYDPLTPDGNMNLVDDYGDPVKHGKQFITIQSKSGSYYYIIIDRDDNGNETVHFLNQVDEADILANMEEEDQAAYDEWKAGIDERKAALEAEQNALDGKPSEDTGTAKDGESDAENPDKKASAKTSSIIIVAVFVIAGVGYLVYTKVIKGKKKTGPREPEIEGFDDEDEDDVTGTETAEIPEEDSENAVSDGDDE